MRTVLIISFVVVLSSSGARALKTTAQPINDTRTASISTLAFAQQARLATEVPGDGFASAGIGYNGVAINGNTAVVASAGEGMCMFEQARHGRNRRS